MTNEERDMITQFIGRVGGAPAGGQASQWGGSVPATTTQPPLPPVDPEANALINQAFQRYPEAAYRMTQLAFVQEHALTELQNRIKRLEWELQQAQQAAQQAQQAAQQQAAQQAPQQQGGSAGGGFFGGLFGGRSQAPPPQQQPGPGPVWNQGAPAPAFQPQYQQAAPPPPQYAPNYQPGMFQRSGSGFLGSALTTAAGVGGGILAADALMDLFGHHNTGGGAFGGGFPGGGLLAVVTPVAGSPALRRSPRAPGAAVPPRHRRNRTMWTREAGTIRAAQRRSPTRTSWTTAVGISRRRTCRTTTAAAAIRIGIPAIPAAVAAGPNSLC